MTEPSHAFTAVVGSEDELRTIYRQPHELVLKKKVPRIDDAARRYIEGAPFCLLATSDGEGRCDVSPRGGPPGFVKVLDETRLAIPDLSGNNILDSLTNVVANGHVGLLFVLPGRDETLRVEGRACLSTDPEILVRWDDELRRPSLAIGVEVLSAYIHCAKAFRRGRVWDADSWAELSAPDVCEVLVENMGLDLPPEAIRADLEAGYEESLAEERV